MASIFSRIVAGEIPCHKVAENEEFFAFLDINPVAVGHTLVIPKKEIDYIFDIEDPMLMWFLLRDRAFHLEGCCRRMIRWFG